MVNSTPENLLSETKASTEQNNKTPPEVLQKIAEIKGQLQESFGKVVLALMNLPRYRNLGIGDLQHLVLEPLLRDRIAMAYQGEQATAKDMAGFAIWASVSEEVNSRILEQINAGTFPVRLRAEDWNSGEYNWLLDIVAPNKHVAASIIANFNKVTKAGGLRLHPMVNRLVDTEILEKLGAEKLGESAPSNQDATQSNVKH